FLPAGNFGQAAVGLGISPTRTPRLPRRTYWPASCDDGNGSGPGAGSQQYALYALRIGIRRLDNVVEIRPAQKCGEYSARRTRSKPDPDALVGSARWKFDVCAHALANCCQDVSQLCIFCNDC